MRSIHLTQVFVVRSANIFDQCDALMEALLDAEDELVFDASIGADAEVGRVMVEVVARGEDLTAAEINGLKRVHDALTQQVGVTVSEVPELREVEELLPA